MAVDRDPPLLMFVLSVASVKGPNSVYSLCHGSKAAERRNRQQQQIRGLSVEPSFILGSLQPVRGALKLTDSVHTQRPQMNKLNAFCHQVRKM